MRNDLWQKPQARVLSFADQERICENEFLSGGPYWHLSTDGKKQEIIFIDDDDFKFAMTCLALLVLEYKVKIIAFVFMNNHLHWILEGAEAECLALFKAFVKRLKAYMHRKGRFGVLDDFDCGTPIPITTLEQMRNEIAYVHRNPYVVRTDVLPYTYRWGDGCLYFNPMSLNIQGQAPSSFSYTELRAILNSRYRELPDSYRIFQNYVLPLSFSYFRKGMNLFRHASHYFGILTKNLESSSEIAKRLGDMVVLNDEEIFPLARRLSSNRYGISSVKDLNGQQKIDIAKTLHFEYHVGNKQVSRVLALDPSIVNQLFPNKNGV